MIAAQPPGQAQPVTGAWPPPEQLEAFAPVVRLLSAIGAVPGVNTIGVTIGELGVDLWVFMAQENVEAEAAISLAEREYLMATRVAGFELHVIPGDDVSNDVLPPYTVVFER